MKIINIAFIITMIVFSTYCKSYCLNNTIILEENNSIILSPNYFEVIDDSLFVLGTSTSEIYMYNKSGKNVFSYEIPLDLIDTIANNFMPFSKYVPELSKYEFKYLNYNELLLYFGQPTNGDLIDSSVFIRNCPRNINKVLKINDSIFVFCVDYNMLAANYDLQEERKITKEIALMNIFYDIKNNKIKKALYFPFNDSLLVDNSSLVLNKINNTLTFSTRTFVTNHLCNILAATIDLSNWKVIDFINYPKEIACADKPIQYRKKDFIINNNNLYFAFDLSNRIYNLSDSTYINIKFKQYNDNDYFSPGNDSSDTLFKKFYDNIDILDNGNFMVLTKVINKSKRIYSNLIYEVDKNGNVLNKQYRPWVHNIVLFEKLINKIHYNLIYNEEKEQYQVIIEELK